MHGAEMYYKLELCTEDRTKRLERLLIFTRLRVHHMSYLSREPYFAISILNAL